MLKAYDLRTEYLINPMGIDTKTPRLSWKIKSSENAILQSAYRLEASAHSDFSEIVFDSGKVFARETYRIKYPGAHLLSGERIYWRVKIWDSKDRESGSSETAFFEMGILAPDDWKAKWIEPEGDIDQNVKHPAPYIRKDFEVCEGLISARAYMTAHGLYEFSLNGKTGTEDLFNPGFTSYYKRLQYQTYDITSLLKEGPNTWGVILGDGWWRGTTSGLIRNNFGAKVAFLGQIVLTYNDGSKSVIASDDTFRTAAGPIRRNDMKDGEVYDARLAMDGWNDPGFDAVNWRAVFVRDLEKENLIGVQSVPVRGLERFTPDILVTPDGKTVLDFGQNMAGIMTMEVEGQPGTKVTMTYGETLDRDGNFTLNNFLMFGMPDSTQTTAYILNGAGIEHYTPRFCVFGFRYVAIDGYPGEIRPEAFTAIAIYSALEETGQFTCSNPLINKLVLNSIWSQKGNFLDVPTDCPTRERAPWTGDGQLYCKTATNFMNAFVFYDKWLKDFIPEQYDDGLIGNYIPSTGSYHSYESFKNNKNKSFFGGDEPGTASFTEGSSGWGDAAVIIPWTMYLISGDTDMLERQFDCAKNWADYEFESAGDSNPIYRNKPEYHTYTDGELDADYIWDTGYHWGEWLEADEKGMGGIPDDIALADITPEIMEASLREIEKKGNPVVATAYLAYSTHLIAEMAEVLGKKKIAEEYAARYEKIKKVYNKYIIKEDGTILEGRQAPYARTLYMDLSDNRDTQKKVAGKLAQSVKDAGYHLNTGFLSTPFLLEALAENGYEEIAFKLLEQESSPGWLYPVTKGATTILESYTGLDTLNMSFNHYSYGAVCDFLFSYVAGIRPCREKPGYRQFLLQPVTGGTLTHAAAEYDSMYGPIKSSWTAEAGRITYQFEIPANTSASVRLPGDEAALRILQKDFPSAKKDGSRIVFPLGSGRYTITL